MRTTLAILLAAVLTAAACKSAPDEPPAPEIRPFPQGWQIVDLTRPLDHRSPYLPHPEAFPFERVPLSPGLAGRRTSAYSLVEHMGTHLSTPATFEAAGQTVDRIATVHLLAELVIVNAPDPAKDGGVSGVAVGAARVRAHEARYGRIPHGALVILRTGLGAVASRDLPPAGARPEGGFAFHGWGAEAVRYLTAERRVRGVGTDGPALDAGPAVDTAPAARLAAGAGVYVLAGLANLSSIPRRGAWAVIGVLPVTGAGGAQARVLALVPPAPGRKATPARGAPRNGE